MCGRYYVDDDTARESGCRKRNFAESTLFTGAKNRVRAVEFVLKDLTAP